MNLIRADSKFYSRSILLSQSLAHSSISALVVVTRKLSACISVDGTDVKRHMVL